MFSSGFWNSGSKTSHDLLNAFDDRSHHSAACRFELLGDIELLRSALDRERNDGAFLDIVHEAILFLDVADHAIGDLSSWNGFGQELAESLVDEIAAEVNRVLIVFGRKGSVHGTNVDRARANINDQRVGESIHAEGDREWFRRNQNRVESGFPPLP